VEWAFPKPWALQMSDNDIMTSVGPNFDVTSTKWPCANGYIGVVPFTTLQSPDDSDIAINVYIYSEKMQFNRATINYLPTNRNLTESKVVDDFELTLEEISEDECLCIQPGDNHLCPFSEDYEDECICDEPGDDPVCPFTIVTESKEVAVDPVTCFVLNPTMMESSKLCEDFFGEQPLSFRSLLKRFQSQYPTTISTYTTPGPAYWQVNLPIFPPIDVTIGGTLSNSYATLWGYLRYAYLAMRGSMRKRIMLQIGNPTNPNDVVLVDLVQPSSTWNASRTQSNGAGGPNMYLEGSLAFIPSTNGGIECELPYYSNNLFAWSCNQNPYNSTPTTVEPTNSMFYDVQFCYTATSTSVQGQFMESFATGEDFMMTRWLGAPPFVGL
jgi:hypothetical protein